MFILQEASLNAYRDEITGYFGQTVEIMTILGEKPDVYCTFTPSYGGTPPRATQSAYAAEQCIIKRVRYGLIAVSCRRQTSANTTSPTAVDDDDASQPDVTAAHLGHLLFNMGVSRSSTKKLVF